VTHLSVNLMSAFTDSGHSNGYISLMLTVCFRPRADIHHPSRPIGARVKLADENLGGN